MPASIPPGCLGLPTGVGRGVEAIAALVILVVDRSADVRDPQAARQRFHEDVAIDTYPCHTVDLVETTNLVKRLAIEQNEVAGGAPHIRRLQHVRGPGEVPWILEHAPIEWRPLRRQREVMTRRPIQDAWLESAVRQGIKDTAAEVHIAVRGQHEVASRTTH